MPAPASTKTSKPAFVRFGTTTGTSATRRSPGKLSRGTPTIMKFPPGPKPSTYWELHSIDARHPSVFSLEVCRTRPNALGKHTLFASVSLRAARVQYRATHRREGKRFTIARGEDAHTQVSWPVVRPGHSSFHDARRCFP